MDIQKIRSQFPVLQEQINGKSLVYFDNGATSQKPNRVIQRIETFYKRENANVHRGVHSLSQIATAAYEKARKSIQTYLGAKNDDEIIFTKGTTDGINLVASSYGELLNEGDEIIISAMEHHSNIVPWQLLRERKNTVLKVIPMNENGELDMKVYEELLNSRTKLVAVTHVSNSLGTV